MRSLRTAIAAAASLVGFVVVLVAHALSGSSSPALLRPNSPASSGSPSNQPASTPTTAAGPPNVHGTRTVTGKVIGYGYGEISVKLTVVNGRIVAAQAAKLATAESYSQQLAQQVIPMLTREVISAQSARISAISGATYTSEGYAYSVQSALDALKRR